MAADVVGLNIGRHSANHFGAFNLGQLGLGLQWTGAASRSQGTEIKMVENIAEVCIDVDCRQSQNATSPTRPAVQIGRLQTFNLVRSRLEMLP